MIRCCCSSEIMVDGALVNQAPRAYGASSERGSCAERDPREVRAECPPAQAVRCSRRPDAGSLMSLAGCKSYRVAVVLENEERGKRAMSSMRMQLRRFASRRTSIALLWALAAGVPSRALGQGYPFSQRGSVTQTVAFTTISIEYGRPVARGRALFGQLVPWDSVWHPGADSATRVTFDHDVLIE